MPTPIKETLDSYQVTSITCGWSHTVGLSACGKVFTWGNGDHGKLGHASTAKVDRPKLVEALAHLRVIKIASYNEHTAALCHAGLGFKHGGGQVRRARTRWTLRKSAQNELQQNSCNSLGMQAICDWSSVLEPRRLAESSNEGLGARFELLGTSSLREAICLREALCLRAIHAERSVCERFMQNDLLKLRRSSELR